MTEEENSAKSTRPFGLREEVATQGGEAGSEAAMAYSDSRGSGSGQHAKDVMAAALKLLQAGKLHLAARLGERRFAGAADGVGRLGLNGAGVHRAPAGR